MSVIPRYLYASEKLSTAVRVMATGRGSLKERLENAFLHIAPLKDDDLPEEVREDFAWVRDQLTRTPINLATAQGKQHHKWGDGDLQWTLKNMRWVRAEEIAQRLWDITSQVERLYVEEAMRAPK